MDNVIANAVKDTELLTERSNPQFTSTEDLVCLNFKVPMRVRQQFKIYAARHNMTMTDLLLRLLDGLPKNGPKKAGSEFFDGATD